MASRFKRMRMSLENSESLKKLKSYKCENTSKVPNQMVTFFMERTLCDVILTTADQEVKVWAHRAILAASSEYFLAMFGGSLKESDSFEIELDQIDGNTLKAVISFMYTSSINLETDTVENIIKAAHLYRLKSLEAICCEYLTSCLELSNCLGIALFAEHYTYTQLYESSFAFVLDNFMQIRNNEEFQVLVPDQLTKFLTSDGLRVRSEEEVFYSIMSWIEYDKINREKFIEQLIQCVRLTFLQPKFIAGTVEPACQSMKCKQLQLSSLPGEQIKLRSLKDVIIAISGWNNAQNILTVGLYYSGYDEWIYRECPGPCEQREEFGYATLGDKLIIAGGKLPSGEVSNRVDCLNMTTFMWTQLSSLRNKRYGCGMTALNGLVYVAGGHNGSKSLGSVERWDPVLDKWEYTTRMPLPEVNSLLGNKGPSLSVSPDRTEIHIYDPSTKLWFPNALKTTGNLVGMLTVSVNKVDYFIVLSTSQIKSVNMANNSIATIPVKHIPLDGNYKYSTLFGDHILVYGLQSEPILKYNPFKNEWSQLPSMQGNQGNLIVF